MRNAIGVFVLLVAATTSCSSERPAHEAKCLTPCMPWEVCKDGVCVADPLDPDWKLDLSPSALPDGQVGVQYRQQLEASGGQGPVTFALASGKLPPGLALDASGLLSGTPSAAGKFAFEVSASDGAEPPMEGSLALSLVVAPAKLVLADATLPDAIVNVAYSASLTASGGTPPYSFAAVSGTDVPGLSLAADGTVSGVPTLAGAFAAVVEVSDSAKPPQTAQAQVYLTVLDSLAIAPSTLARATIDEPYEAQLQGVGGTPPYLIELAGGALPPGIDLDAGGLLGGVPTATGDFAFDLRVVDAHAREALQPFTLTVLPPAPVFASHPLPEGMVGQPYSAQLEATGGLQPLVLQARAGHLPPGLQLTQQGALEGTPESSGNYELAFLVIDAAQRTAVATFELTILDALQAGPLPDGVLGRPYSALVEVSGGRAPIELQLDKGSLPDGLELNPSGLVSGVPREVGRFDFQVLATDSSSPAWSLPLALSIEILPGSLAILEDPLPRGIVGVPYSAALLAEGGIEPLSW
ncbi:MAG: putative Ig domain-containing protein, partial [Myxococcales bacterium]